MYIIEKGPADLTLQACSVLSSHSADRRNWDYSTQHSAFFLCKAFLETSTMCFAEDLHPWREALRAWEDILLWDECQFPRDLGVMFPQEFHLEIQQKAYETKAYE